MKPIAIIAIIAAVVVVGGACAGVAFSGVFNGGTTGPGGDEPVVPTDPVEPTPTETPTETPTPTPTDSSMSYFSPMTSSGSGSSGSGSSTSAGCNHANVEWVSDDAGSHSKVCKDCGETVGTAVSCSDFEYFVLDENHHLKKCSDCGYEMSVECSEPADEYIVNVAEMKHQQQCKYCGNALESETPCTLPEEYTFVAAETAHSKTCSVCHHEYKEHCDSGAEGEKPQSNSDGTHALTTCSVCQNTATIAECSRSDYEPKGNGKHSDKCGVCGYVFPDSEVNCPEESYSYDKNNEAGTHTVKCDLCGGTVTATAECAFGDYTYLLTVDEPVQIRTCGHCGCEEKTTIVAAVGQIGYTTVTYAIDNATTGDVVKLLADMQTETVIPAGTKVVINLNGKSAMLNYADFADIKIKKDGWSEDKDDGIKVTVDGDAKSVWFNNTISEDDLLVVVGCVEADDVLGIYTADGLKAFEMMVNAGDFFSGKTAKLMVDEINLNNEPWTPIGSGDAHFAGTFDGNSKTISNLKVNAAQKAGLFGDLRGTIKDLTVVNADVTGNHWAGVIAAYSTDNCKAEITGCTVKDSFVTLTTELINGEYDNGDKAGGIMGYIDHGNPGISGCTVEKTTIKAYRDLGGIVGYANSTVTKNAVNKVTLTLDNTHNYKNYKADSEYDCGFIVGELAKAGVKEGNTVDGEPEPVVAAPKTLTDLKALMEQAASGSSTDIIVNLEDDFAVTDTDTWEAFSPEGYNGVTSLTINGNNHKITGLTAPLTSGFFAGAGNVIINDLTINDAIIEMNGVGTINAIGAFVCYSDASGSIVLNSCHLVNSKVNCTDAYAGGLIGYSSSPVTITGCSVTGSTIASVKSTGSIIGHVGAAATVESVTATGNTLIGNINGDDAREFGVGAIFGRSNSGCDVTMTTVTISDNTITQEGATTSATNAYYGTSYGTTTLDGSTL